jgi:hypothetical protein
VMHAADATNGDAITGLGPDSHAYPRLERPLLCHGRRLKRMELRREKRRVLSPYAKHNHRSGVIGSLTRLMMRVRKASSV